MEALLDLIRLFIVAHLFLLIGMIIRAPIRRQDAWITIAFILGLLGYLVLSANRQEFLPFFSWMLILSISFPWSFWMMGKVLFDDDFQFKPWMLLALIGTIAYSISMQYLMTNQLIDRNSQMGHLFRLLSFAISLGFVILAIVEALKNKEADLITDRRNFRNWFVLSTATMVVLTVLTEITFMNSSPPIWLDLIQKSFIFVLTYYFFLRRFEFQPGFFQTQETGSKTEIPSSAPSVDEQLVNRLMNAMEQEKIYRTEGLSISQLANHLEAKEYILRQTINQHLGFRNFNAFLNDYRIEDACTILSDPDQQQLTILEIAYDLGYKSLAPFNKAFKAKTSMTPTAWRKSRLSDK